MDWYRSNYPEVIEGRNLVPVPWLEERTGAAGQTVPGWGAFIDSDRPVDKIVGTIRHETLHLDETLGDVLKRGVEDIAAMVKNLWDPTQLPYGPRHEQIYLEGDRFEKLYRESQQP
jgi:hypothetical protein